jgi:hypothetical protein
MPREAHAALQTHKLEHIMPTTLPVRMRAAAPRRLDGGDWMVLLGNAVILFVLFAGLICTIWIDPLLISTTDFASTMAGP